MVVVTEPTLGWGEGGGKQQRGRVGVVHGPGSRVGTCVAGAGCGVQASYLAPAGNTGTCGRGGGGGQQGRVCGHGPQPDRSEQGL